MTSRTNADGLGSRVTPEHDVAKVQDREKRDCNTMIVSMPQDT